MGGYDYCQTTSVFQVPRVSYEEYLKKKE